MYLSLFLIISGVRTIQYILVAFRHYVHLFSLDHRKPYIKWVYTSFISLLPPKVNMASKTNTLVMFMLLYFISATIHPQHTLALVGHIWMQSVPLEEYTSEAWTPQTSSSTCRNTSMATSMLPFWLLMLAWGGEKEEEEEVVKNLSVFFSRSNELCGLQFYITTTIIIITVTTILSLIIISDSHNKSTGELLPP